MPLTICLHCSTPTVDHDGRCPNCGHYAAQHGSDCECPNCVPKREYERPAHAGADSGDRDWRSRVPSRRTAGAGQPGNFATR
jgi:hypothetical protein